MTQIKTNCQAISEIAPYFKSLEKMAGITFLQRRNIMMMNQKIELDYTAFSKEMENIKSKYCETNEKGEYIETEVGSIKIKPELVKECSSILDELLMTEVIVEWNDYKFPESFFNNFTCSQSTFKFIEQII